MIYCVDIDGVICNNTYGKYEEAKPDIDAIVKVNRLYGGGHTIKYFTARGSTTGIDWREVTEKQFKKWGVKCHELIFGKPEADLYIDDKAFNYRSDLRGDGYEHK